MKKIYIEAEEQRKQALQNFEYAESAYIDTAIFELKAAMEKVKAIRNNIKMEESQ